MIKTALNWITATMFSIAPANCPIYFEDLTQNHISCVIWLHWLCVCYKTQYHSLAGLVLSICTSYDIYVHCHCWLQPVSVRYSFTVLHSCFVWHNFVVLYIHVMLHSCVVSYIRVMLHSCVVLYIRVILHSCVVLYIRVMLHICVVSHIRVMLHSCVNWEMCELRQMWT